MKPGDPLAELERLAAQARAAGQAGAFARRARELAAELEEERGAQAGRAQAEFDPQSAQVPLRCGMVGASPPFQALCDLIERVAKHSVPVLVLGETGTGKELVARALHQLSARKRKRFLAENCAAVPPNLLESELFGHKKGAFTGAFADRDGHFVAAHGGSLFLDEIGDMPLDMQAKLLRVLETGEVRPVGSSEVRRVDVRVIAATHRDLVAMVEKRTFREDLYYRLNVVKLVLAPLRERHGDSELLARFFLTKAAFEERAGVRSLEPAALAALRAFPWPGNVRQLENEIRRAVALASGPTIQLSDLSPALQGRV